MSTAATPPRRYRGQPIDAALVRTPERVPSTDTCRARAVLRRDGVVWLEQALPIELVRAARQCVAETLTTAGAAYDVDGQLFAISSTRDSPAHTVPGSLWCALTHEPPIRQLAQGFQTAALLAALMGESEARAERAVYVRAIRRGAASRLHVDYPAIEPPDPRTLKLWIALADADVSAVFFLPMRGALQFLRCREPFAADQFRSRFADEIDADLCAWLTTNESEVLSGSLNPGDVLVFDSMCPHASFDNICPSGRIRLSIDVGWQPAQTARSDQVGPPTNDPSAYAQFVGARDWADLSRAGI